MEKKKSADGKRASAVSVALVWLFRLLVGSVFIVSGVTKLVDLWGTVFKIEDYIDVWGLDVPRTVVMMGALFLSSFEFTAGLLLLTGCYRRVVTWLLSVCMLFMLPLTAYIWIADPVSDCGCFGDYIVISNAATFWKNVVLLAMIVYLVVYNRKAMCLFKAPIQWLVVTVTAFYCIVVSLIGYNIQPMLDFRPYPIGSQLIGEDGEADAGVGFRYVRDGDEAVFDASSLPDEDEGWTYVGRVEADSAADGGLAVYDPESGDDVTIDYLADVDSLLLLIIPEPARADLSYTYSINELADAVTRDGGSIVALLATGSKGIDRWKDHSMASYPCLSADDTQLKQLSRGVMSMVWVTNDTIRWKRTVSSINLDEVEAVARGDRSVGSLGFDGAEYMLRLTLLLVAFLIVLLVLQTAAVKIPRRGNHKRSKDVAQVKNVH